MIEALAGLRDEGVVRRGAKPGHWRFRLPLLATSVTACLGPYERRSLSQLAVTAIWAGGAGSDDRYLAETALERQLRPVTDDLTGHLIPDCGHIIPLDRPQELLSLLVPFLADQPTRSRDRLPRRDQAGAHRHERKLLQ